MTQQPTDIRRTNLRRVTEELGGPAAVAKRLKLSGPSWLSQIMSGHRPFTEKTARKFERQLGLKHGSLDRSAAFDDASGHVVVNRDVPQVSHTLMVIQSLLATRDQKLTNAQFGAVADVVFSQALKTGIVDEELAGKILDLLG